MAITAAMVKELREMTGAGMMDCKKALNETNGDMDAAVEFLRKNGQAKAEKKAGRIAVEGLCTVVVKDDKTAAVVEVNSETDFVAKNDTFKTFVEAVAAQAVNSDAADLDAFMAEAWNEDSSKTVKDNSVINCRSLCFYDNADSSAAVNIRNHASVFCGNFLKSADI